VEVIINISEKEATFNTIYTNFLSYVTEQANINTNQETDAEDVVQIVFKRVFEAINKGIEVNASWIKSTTKTTIINYSRDETNFNNRTTTEDLEEKYATNHIEDDPERLLRFKEQYALIKQAAISYLTESQIQIVELIIKGYGYQEIANKLTLTIEQVRGRLKRARATLRKEVRHEMG